MKYLPGMVALVLLIGLVALKRNLEPSLAEVPRRPPQLESLQARFEARSWKRMALGFDNAIASTLWVGLLQNARFTPVSRGLRSWESSQLEAITTLDPKFEPAYGLGASWISYFRRDPEGGKLLLEKWVRVRPHYWRAHHLLGMHYFLELGDARLAATHVLRAAQLAGAPEWLRSLGVRLLSTSGAWSHALQTAIDLYPTTSDFEARSRLEARIRSLRFQIQKRGWTEALDRYRQKNHRDPKMLAELENFYPAIERRPSAEMGNDRLRALLNEKFKFRYRGRKIESADAAVETALADIQVHVPELPLEKGAP